MGNPHLCERCHVDIFSETFKPRNVDEPVAIIVPSDSTVSVQGDKEKWIRQDNHTYRLKTYNWVYNKVIATSFDDKQKNILKSCSTIEVVFSKLS